MKKVFLSMALLLSLGVAAWAQTPQQFNYQGIARSIEGTPMASTLISLRLTVHEGSSTGSVDYQETQTTTTNQFGIYTVFIGAGLVNTAGGGALTLGAVNWGTGSKYLQVEIDPMGAANYSPAGTAQLLSVPYALYAANSPATGVTQVTAGAGLNGGTITTTGTISMPSVGVPGTYGDSTHVASITTDAQGRVTGVTNKPITAGAGTITNINTGAGLTGGPITASGTISLGTAGTAGTYGSSTQVPVFTTDIYGRVTSVTNTSIVTSGTGTVTSVTAGAGLLGGTITSSGTVSMPTVGTAGTYGSTTAVPVITTDAYGRVTGVTTATISTGGVSGTTNYIAKFTSATAVGNSGMYQNGVDFGINTLGAQAPLEVNGGSEYRAINGYNSGSAPSDSGVVCGIYAGSSISTTVLSAGVYGQAAPDGFTDNAGLGIFGLGGRNGLLGEGVTFSVATGASQATGAEGDGFCDGDFTVGIAGFANSVFGSPGFEYGVFGTTDNFGLTNYAGKFIGDVDVTGTLTAGTKLFKIDHPLDPENKYLYHGCVESNEMMNIYTGNITTDASGVAVVQFPAYMEALNKDFRYQLTVMGTFAQAIVSKEMSGNQFEIKTSTPNVKVSWQVTGVRHDAYANAHPLIVEKAKTGLEKGKYVNPIEYGKTADMGIGQLKSAKSKKDLVKKNK